jgi:transketolase
MRQTSLRMVHALARRDPRVLYIGSDPGGGTLDAMKDEFPDRFFIEGISEANVIGMAAGLAMEGFIPYVNTIATFLTRRCYDQIAVDLCLHQLPVRLIANGGGLVYAPLGPTHQAIEDIAIMRALPNMTVVAVSDGQEMQRFMELSLDWPGPIYVRLAKGGDPVISRPELGFAIGKPILLRPPGDILIVSTGVLSGHALAAADSLVDDGIACGVLHVPSWRARCG